MSKRRSAFLVLLAVLCVLVLSTVVLAQEEVPAPYAGLKNPFGWNDARVQTTGRGIYLKNCFVCHGDRGNEVIEVDFTAPDHRGKMESRPDYFFWRVSEGVPGKEMKAWKSLLSETERWQALTYVWSLGTAPPTSTPAPAPVPVPVPTPSPALTPAPAPAAPGTPNIPDAPPAPGTPPTTGTPAATGAPATTPLAIIGRADIGERLFTGEVSLLNKGPSCLTCHNNKILGMVGGGTLGKDLTGTYSLYGEGLASLLKKLRFPMMKAIYGAKPLTDGEIADLTAFLKKEASIQSPSTQDPAILFAGSTTGALLIILLFQLLWRGRLSGVRSRLVKGGSR